MGQIGVYTCSFEVFEQEMLFPERKRLEGNLGGEFMSVSMSHAGPGRDWTGFP
jgi:hypothetical protein